MTKLKIIAVDDSTPIREHLQRAFAQVEAFSLIGMAADGEEGLKMVRALKPDIVVLDISMPQKDGMQVLREIREEDDRVIIIMFTLDPSPLMREVCLEAGANFYIEKTQIKELLEICRSLLKQ